MARSISRLPPPPPGICLLILKFWQITPRWGFWKSANDQSAEQENNRPQINIFYRNCNSSNRFLTAKTATFSRTVNVLLSVISRSQVETIVQIFAHVGVEPYASFEARKDRVVFDNAPPPDWPYMANTPPWGRRNKKLANKCPRGRWAALDLLEPLWATWL